jgi:hypothetical protein
MAGYVTATGYDILLVALPILAGSTHPAWLAGVADDLALAGLERRKEEVSDGQQ